jgi:transposase InsO family protein
MEAPTQMGPAGICHPFISRGAPFPRRQRYRVSLGPGPVEPQVSHERCLIEGWYNPMRLHSGLGYRSPTAYEAAMEAVTTEP